MKKRIEEARLIEEIRTFKKDLRSRLSDKFLAERDSKHKLGYVFYRGFWVPREKSRRVQHIIRKRSWIIFFELHLLFLLVAVSCSLLWVLFKRIILP